ncbi:MAG: TRAP transporter small permease [Deltaproteobacteria bacterium]|jgi:C4-dicarboxylate transporter, DctQ subunit|nr:TRAP transporter small permease [Deltaproteobacteria bacterium]
MYIWDRFDEKLSRVEQAFVTILLTVMILMAFFQIVLRNFFDTGISWGDSLVRYLVVWVGFIGAAIATKEGKHINIDVASRWLTGPQSNYIRLVSHFFSAVICGLLTLAAIKFLRFEAQMGSTAFFKLPVWVPEIIIPVTFGLMTLRFAVRFLSELARIRRHDFKQEFKQKK